MKTYIGSRLGHDRIVVLVSEDNKTSVPLAIEPSQHIHNHSSEFNWGYSGSGPSQMALAILLDSTGNSVTASQWYQEFKFDFVNKWEDRWKLTSAEIDGWLRVKGAQVETKKVQYSHEPQFPKELGGKE